jgi:hypothetical protein
VSTRRNRVVKLSIYCSPGQSANKMRLWLVLPSIYRRTMSRISFDCDLRINIF